MQPASGRLRLRPWLEEQIQSGKYPGVSWLDQSALIFQIPWKHAARHGWSIDRDATLFRSWAVHTGRYRPGRDKPDPKTWKANFRCALNSLPDVTELQEHSRKRGSNALRVYRMLPNTHTHTHRRGRRGLRLFSRSRERQSTSGEDTNTTHSTQTWQPTTQTWQPTTTRTETTTNQRADNAAGDAGSNIHVSGLWENKPEDQEQNQAVFKLMDHFTNTNVWSVTDQRDWRTHTPLWDNWHSADDNVNSLHPEGYNELFNSNYIKEFSDWSIHQQTTLP